MNFKDGFEYHAEKIMQQIKATEICTKSQLEFLILYNEISEFEKPYYLSQGLASNLTVIKERKPRRLNP